MASVGSRAWRERRAGWCTVTGCRAAMPRGRAASACGGGRPRSHSRGPLARPASGRVASRHGGPRGGEALDSGAAPDSADRSATAHRSRIALHRTKVSTAMTHRRRPAPPHPPGLDPRRPRRHRPGHRASTCPSWSSVAACRTAARSTAARPWRAERVRADRRHPGRRVRRDAVAGPADARASPGSGPTSPALLDLHYGLSLIGVIFEVYFLTLQIFVIHAVCIWCTALRGVADRCGSWWRW